MTFSAEPASFFVRSYCRKPAGHVRYATGWGGRWCVCVSPGMASACCLHLLGSLCLCAVACFCFWVHWRAPAMHTSFRPANRGKISRRSFFPAGYRKFRLGWPETDARTDGSSCLNPGLRVNITHGHAKHTADDSSPGTRGADWLPLRTSVTSPDQMRSS